MKIRLIKSGRYEGYQVGINAEDETLTIENTEGKQVASLALEDFLDRLGATKSEFKRQHPRLELGTHIKYFNSEGQLCDAIASSLGAGGLFIDQFSPPPMGTPVRLEIHLPASKNVIKADSKVVWIRKSIVEKIFYPGMGLKFTSIADKDRAEILQFIKKFNRQRGFHEFGPDHTPA
ncbi:MAG: PilZ domain-containing protein [Nitrospirae bacterium]|nr:PilZ domain-containing protein [Nitrospirota bacterium]